MGITLDPIDRGAACLRTAFHRNNLRAGDPKWPLRLQLLCDAVGYFRGGRMATRFGVRSPDLLRWHNSPYYFKNVALYLAGDHTEQLYLYLGKTFAQINRFSTQAAVLVEGRPLLDEVGNAVITTSCAMCFTEQGFGVVDIVDGGDAAAANAMAAVECPPSRLGCCTYCEGRRVHWFDKAKCENHQRRNFVRSCLLAHLLPPGWTTAVCPACKEPLTAETEATGKKRHDEMTESARDDYNKEHRNLHFGLLPFTRKIFWTDHINRYPSLLHFILNSTSSTLAINVAAGASKALREELNEKLASYSCLYRFALKPGSREKKPCGNVCRAILWTPGFLLSLITARWGPPASSTDKQATTAVDELQRANENMMHPDDPRPGGSSVRAAVTRAASEVTVRGGPNMVESAEFASVAALLGLSAAPPAPAAPLPTAAAPTTDDTPVLAETPPDGAAELGLDTHATDEETEYVPATVIGTRESALDSLFIGCWSFSLSSTSRGKMMALAGLSAQSMQQKLLCADAHGRLPFARIQVTPSVTTTCTLPSHIWRSSYSGTSVLAYKSSKHHAYVLSDTRGGSYSKKC